MFNIMIGVSLNGFSSFRRHCHTILMMDYKHDGCCGKEYNNGVLGLA